MNYSKVLCVFFSISSYFMLLVRRKYSAFYSTTYIWNYSYFEDENFTYKNISAFKIWSIVVDKTTQDYIK